MITGHGDEYVGELVANFSSNVWYGADNSALHEHLHHVMPKIARYPETDAASFKNVLAHTNSIETSELLVCNGSTEAFYLIANTYSNGISLIVSPTFSEYADACKMHNHKVIITNRKNLIDNIKRSKPNLIWICNPNNPDGFCYSALDLKSMLNNYPDSHFVIDQAYIDFTFEKGFSAVEIKEFKNLILVQSLTKRHAIPGLRLGYLMANKNTIQKIKAFCIPWSVNTLAIEAGKYILENETTEFKLDSWLNNTKLLQKKISELDNYQVISSQTSYFLVKLLKGKANELKAYLLKEKMLVRDATNFELLNGEHIRICTQSAQKNELLISKLKAWNPNITV